jgi:hypothetical protein
MPQSEPDNEPITTKYARTGDVTAGDAAGSHGD